MKPTPTLLVVFALLGPAAADDARSDRARALEALKSKLPAAERYLRHSLAVEAISRELAAPGDDVDHWGLAGLLHDIDIGETAADLSRHGVVGAEIVRGACRTRSSMRS
jgi:putative nucleotidyltransferase with HDIG domain